ncbi:MAG: response regulator [Gammaproteobacteria bacterium]|nr:response regulator [Gammaproteobacteria bacterium]
MMKKRILVVDDEVALTRMIKMNLERSGDYEVRTENQGVKVLSVVREFWPDLIFLDVMMPGMSGDEIAQQLREDPVLAGIKIVFMTAIVTKEETSEMSGNIGGNEFLAKPVKTEELVETIEKILGA